MKICVHITHYDTLVSQNTGNLKKSKKKILQEIILNYKKINHTVDIFVHSNSDNQISIPNVKWIYHDLDEEKNKNKLTWKCRNLIKKQQNNYDVFIYSEDDILFNQKNFDYWIKFKDICLSKNLNLGFILAEKNELNNFFAVRNPKKLYKFFNINNKNFFINDVNPYYCLWIMDQNELKKFIKTKWYKFEWKGKNPYAFYGTAEMSAIGWHGKNMNRYKYTVILETNKKPANGSMLHHLSNNYIDKYLIENNQKQPYCIHKFEDMIDFNKKYKIKKTDIILNYIKKILILAKYYLLRKILRLLFK